MADEGALARIADRWRDDQPLDLSDADLSGADLRDADLTFAKLARANLTGADLTDADLRNADLHSATLENTTLDGANLFEASLRNARCHGATFTGASLAGADLRTAVLAGAEIDPNDLLYAVVRPADLLNAGIPLPTGTGVHVGRDSVAIVLHVPDLAAPEDLTELSLGVQSFAFLASRIGARLVPPIDDDHAYVGGPVSVTTADDTIDIRVRRVQYGSTWMTVLTEVGPYVGSAAAGGIAAARAVSRRAAGASGRPSGLIRFTTFLLEIPEVRRRSIARARQEEAASDALEAEAATLVARARIANAIATEIESALPSTHVTSPAMVDAFQQVAGLLEAGASFEFPSQTPEASDGVAEE